MTTAIATIRAEIKKKKSTLTSLKKDEKELERLKKEVAAIPRVQADLSALERTLAILQGEEVPESSGGVSASEETSTESIPTFAYSILKDTGKPMTGDDLHAAFLTKGKEVSKSSLLGALYRNVKKNRLFRLVSSGTFGLLDWPEPAKEEQ
jgi:hypothetical protein